MITRKSLSFKPRASSSLFSEFGKSKGSVSLVSVVVSSISKSISSVGITDRGDSFGVNSGVFYGVRSGVVSGVEVGVFSGVAKGVSSGD